MVLHVAQLGSLKRVMGAPDLRDDCKAFARHLSHPARLLLGLNTRLVCKEWKRWMDDESPIFWVALALRRHVPTSVLNTWLGDKSSFRSNLLDKLKSDYKQWAEEDRPRLARQRISIIGKLNSRRETLAKLQREIAALEYEEAELDDRYERQTIQLRDMGNKRLRLSKQTE